MRPAPSPPPASAVFVCGSTFWPGFARMSPPVMTLSSGLSPLSITRQLADRWADLDLALLDDVLAVDDQHDSGRPGRCRARP